MEHVTEGAGSSSISTKTFEYYDSAYAHNQSLYTSLSRPDRRDRITGHVPMPRLAKVSRSTSSVTWGPQFWEVPTVPSPRPFSWPAFLVESFLGHPAQVSYVHRIARLSFKKKNTQKRPWYNSNVDGTTPILVFFIFGRGELHETKPCSHVFPQGDIRAFLAPNSERHCDSSCGECGNVCCKSRRINHYGHKAKDIQ